MRERSVLRILWVPAAAAVLLLTLAACPGTGPEHAPYPTGEQIVANSRAFGVPYGRYILLRHDRQLLALNISSRSRLGDSISYQWWVVTPGSPTLEDTDLTHGGGETSEQPFEGRITLPGLGLVWSRGSSEMGWLYWPEGDRAVSVNSSPCLDRHMVESCSRAGKWLSREMFPD